MISLTHFHRWIGLDHTATKASNINVITKHMKFMAIFSDGMIIMAEQMKRYCFALDLHNDADLIDQYKQWHLPGAVPLAVLDMIRLQDIRALDIYNCGDRLFMIMEVGADFNADKAAVQDRQSADVQAWQTMMWRFQKPLPFASDGQKWVPMDHIFTLPTTP